MCIRIEVITPDPCEARAFTSDEGATFTTVSRLQTLLVVVAVPSDPASRLIADMGAGDVQDGHGEKVRESQKQVHYDYKNRLEEYDAKV